MTVENVSKNWPAAAVGKMTGRIGCGGAMHYDPGKRDWPGPLVLKIEVGGESVLEVPITGFDVRRDQHDYGRATRILFEATEL